MKKTLLVTFVLFSFFSAKAQNETNLNPYEKNNEIKLNVIAPLSGAFQAGYERHLNPKSSLGISFYKVYDNTNNEDLNYSISPYYRRYFAKSILPAFLLKDLEC